MKKAKMMLVGLALFATVGGALAFKARTFNGTLFCTAQQRTACTEDVKYRVGNDIFTTQLFCSDVAADCATQTETQKVIEDAR